jgi:hypothetical protein
VGTGRAATLARHPQHPRRQKAGGPVQSLQGGRERGVDRIRRVSKHRADSRQPACRLRAKAALWAGVPAHCRVTPTKAACHNTRTDCYLKTATYGAAAGSASDGLCASNHRAAVCAVFGCQSGVTSPGRVTPLASPGHPPGLMGDPGMPAGLPAALSLHPGMGGPEGNIMKGE